MARGDRRADWRGTPVLVWRRNDTPVLTVRVAEGREEGRHVVVEVPEHVARRLAEDADLDYVTIDVPHDCPRNEATLEHTVADMTAGLAVRHRVLTSHATPTATRVRFWGDPVEIATLVEQAR